MLPDPQRFFRQVLRREFRRIAAKNAHFSRSAFAKRLRMTSAALSEIFAGKRRVSERRAVAALKSLNTPKETLALLRAAFAVEAEVHEARKIRTDRDEEFLPEKHYSLLRDWIFLGVLSLIRSSGPKPVGLKELSKRLALPAAQVQQALDALRDAGMIAEEKDGSYSADDTVYLPPDAVPAAFGDARVRQSVAAMAAALDDGSPSWRFGLSSTISTDPAKLEAAKRLIEDFVRVMAAFLDSGSPSEVFEINVNLFARTKEARTVW